MKTYKVNFHSFIDVITNSSSELFVSTDQKIVEFFKSILKDGDKDLIKIVKFKDFKDKYIDESYEHYNRDYVSLKDDDDILLCNVDSEEIYYTLPELLTKLSFKSVYE